MLKKRKRLRRSKPLLMGLLLALVISGCETAPKPPAIEMYIHDAGRGQAYCSRSDGKECLTIEIEQTDNWFLFPPVEWEKIQNYIDLLVCKLEGGCKDDQEVVSPASVSFTPEDLKKISKKMTSLRMRLESQRSDNAY